MEILEKFFFDSPLGLVCLAVVDDGYAVKAYLGPVPGHWSQDEAAGVVVARGAPVALQTALTMSGPRSWGAAAKYDPAVAMMLGLPFTPPTAPAPGPGPAAAIFHQGRRSAPTWPGAPGLALVPDPLTHGPAAAGLCSCTLLQRGLCAVDYRPGNYRPAGCIMAQANGWPTGTDAGVASGTIQPTAPGPAETVGTPAACNCTPAENHRCYFVGALGRPGCVHETEIRAQMSKDPPAPAAPGVGPGPVNLEWSDWDDDDAQPATKE